MQFIILASFFSFVKSFFKLFYYFFFLLEYFLTFSAFFSLKIGFLGFFRCLVGFLAKRGSKNRHFSQSRKKKKYFSKTSCNFETNVVKYRSIWMKIVRTLSGAVIFKAFHAENFKGGEIHAEHQIRKEES